MLIELHGCKIFYDPTLEEIYQLGSEYWDTIRGGICDTGKLVFANGYGHTHSTIYTILRAKFGKRAKETGFIPFILYWENSGYYLNLMDMDGPEETPKYLWKKYFTNGQLEVLINLIEATKMRIGEEEQI